MGKKEVWVAFPILAEVDHFQDIAMNPVRIAFLDHITKLSLIQNKT